VNPDTGKLRTFDAGAHPAQLAVTRGKVFIAGHTRDLVVVLDARNGKPIRDVDVAANPYGVAARGRHVWVTGESNTLTRLDVES
jgi:hypothetical protein